MLNFETRYINRHPDDPSGVLLPPIATPLVYAIITCFLTLKYITTMWKSKSCLICMYNNILYSVYTYRFCGLTIYCERFIDFIRIRPSPSPICNDYILNCLYRKTRFATYILCQPIKRGGPVHPTHPTNTPQYWFRLSKIL